MECFFNSFQLQLRRCKRETISPKTSLSPTDVAASYVACPVRWLWCAIWRHFLEIGVKIFEIYKLPLAMQRARILGMHSSGEVISPYQSICWTAALYFRSVVAKMAPPDFGRTINPISTKGADYAHQIILAPPDFQTFRRPLQCVYISTYCLLQI